MKNQQKVILVGLGKFGKNVSDNLLQMIEERKIQLGEIASSVLLYPVNFDDEKVFHSSVYLRKFIGAVENSSAYKNGEEFSVIYIGDLAENAVAKYAIDFAYLPYLLQQSTAFKFDEVLGFFTFADQLGITESVSDETLALICAYFKRLEEINKNNCYVPPFKTVNGKSFKTVDSPSGPFNRNYLVITPGKSTSVANETSVVFAERIFYELFYLSEKLNEQSRNWSSDVSRKENSDRNLSCFSMVQIPRINEVQKYYLKYVLEDRIFSNFVSEPLRGTDGEYYLKKFFEMIDVPSSSDDFPIERARELFVQKYKENFTHLLNYFISGKHSDFKDYIEESKKRIEKTVFELQPRFDEFAHKEINNFFVMQKTGFESLFKMTRINGNFKTYISFVEQLKTKLENWENSLKVCSEKDAIYNLDLDFSEIDGKIKKYQKNFLLSFPPFRPIRKKLIENAILSIPVEKYLDSLVQKNLAKSLYEYWRELIEQKKSAIDECEKLLFNLKSLVSRFEDKEKYVRGKISFIENMNVSYYNLPMFTNSEDYLKLLGRIKERNFGAHNSQKINEVISNVLKLWSVGKDIFSITQNATEFLDFIENKFIPDNKNIFSEIEEDVEGFAKFAEKAVEETQYKTENINSISFETSGTSLFQNEIIFEPKLDERDRLNEIIDSKFDSKLKKIEIPKDFTLGSIVYFKDFLYMSQKSLKKKDSLDEYQNKETSKREYDDALASEEKLLNDSSEKTAENVISNNHEEQKEPEVSETSSPASEKNDAKPDETWKFTRAALTSYVDPVELVEIYNKTFNDAKDFVSEQEIENLSLTIRLEEALKYLSDDKLQEFAKDNDIPLRDERERQEKLIVYELTSR